MKTSYLLKQSNYIFFRTAIEAKILFELCLNKKQALTGGKSLACEDKCRKKIVSDIGAAKPIGAASKQERC
ncbi:hypothetical protein [Treponema pedis]|uniref:hypothetical protein n=1 Tax=Treponema pedis TaxID=409322 RepID=UPI0004126E0C|nr:hypothetical protein [Treponema pedis]